jgi:N-acetylmuramoyl-L-alanine amidase
LFKKTPLLYILLSLVLFDNLGASSVRVVNRVTNSTDEIRTLDNLRGTYVSVKDVSRVLSTKEPYINNDRLKMVIYIGNNRLKISGNSSYILVDERVYQTPSFAIWDNSDIYVQAEALFNLIKETTMPGIDYDARRMVLDIDIKEFNITGIEISEKANGTVLRLKTRSSFPEGNISSFFHENGWFYITIADALVDTTEIRRSDTRGVVRNITADQLESTAQIAFQIKTKVESHELYQGKDPSEIVVSLRTPMDNSVARIKEVKDRWKLDTIVLDAGHGGKDPGTMGPRGTKEKDIALDIVKRVGLLLEKNTKLKVIYTREEDIFIPLWKRTKVANESNGKVFLSIHLNGSPNKSAYGFETYLLRPGKTEDAIEVASRENEVIKFEDRSDNRYKDLSGENLIMATMAQSIFMRESEELAAMIQEEMAKKIKSKNRGVKQAGFHVLIGASMPNILVEAGYLTNRNEEKNLRNAKYRQAIANCIYKAIVKFRYSREQYLAEN